MGMFPETPEGANEKFGIHMGGYSETQKDPRIAAQQDFIIGLLKKGHAIIRALGSNNMEKVEAATVDLIKTIEQIDLTDPEQSGAMAALIMSMGVAIPPTAYGEDFEKWDEYDND